MPKKILIIFISIFALIIGVNNTLAGSATISWNTNNEPDIDGYKIYYGTSQRNNSCPDGGYSSSVDVGNITSYTFNDLTNNQTYYFSVTAYDTSNNESCFSDEVSKQTTVSGGGGISGGGSSSSTSQKPLTATTTTATSTVQVAQSNKQNNNNATTSPNINFNVLSVPSNDLDNDGLSNLLEEALGTSKSSNDSDNDGYSDKEEIINGYNPAGTGKMTLDANLSKKLSGKILLQVERKGEAWYVYPDNLKKYFLGRPQDAFNIMRRLGLGVKHEIITKYIGGKFPDRLAGKILIDVEDKGKAYYIDTKDKKAYYLGRPQDAFEVMRKQGLGITNSNINKIRPGLID